MHELKLKYVDNKPNIMLESTALSIVLKDKYYVCPDEKNEFTNNYVNHSEISIDIILQMAMHAFYLENLGIENSICTFLYFDKKQLFEQKKYLTLFFNKVTILSCEYAQSKQPIYQIKLQGIHSRGLSLLNELIKYNNLPHFILDLYIGKKFANDYRKDALFSVCSDNLKNIEYENYWIHSLLEGNRFLQCLDISTLTLEQCTTHPLIQYIAGRKDNVYIYVSQSIEQENLFHKTLCWA